METKTPLRAQASPAFKPGHPSVDPARAGLDELRRLLVGEEQRRIGALERRLDPIRVEAEQVSDVLAEAVLFRSRKDGQLSQALSPTVRESLGIAVRQDPKLITEAIFPIMGPAIGRAISEKLAKLIQWFNKTLENNLSPQALKWRLEAFRTGKPFAEVVFRHTLVYRVEEVFLFHRPSGFLLQQATVPATIPGNDSVAPGILNTIQDFVKSAHHSSYEDSPNTLELGELTVWVETGPSAVLAAVIRGKPPVELRDTLKAALDAVHAETGQELYGFSGETAPLESCRRHLQECLVEVQRSNARKNKSSAMGPEVLAVVGLMVVIWAFFSWRSSSKWNSLFDELRSTPGIQVTEVDRHSGKHRLRGLRDPLAVDPLSIAAHRGLPPGEIELRLEPYCSLAPEIVEARAQALLKPPAGVDLKLERGALSLSGLAPAAWIARAEMIAAAVPGVTEVRTSGLCVASNDPELLSRVRSILKPPSSVNLSVKDGVLHASGSAPHDWIADAGRLVSLLPEVKAFAHPNLINLDEHRMNELKVALERLQFAFEGGTADLSAGSREMLSPTVLKIDQLARTTLALDRRLRISVLATKAPDSPDSTPRGLEKLRAEALVRALNTAGIDASIFASGDAMDRDPSTEDSSRDAESLMKAIAFLRVTIGPVN